MKKIYLILAAVLSAFAIYSCEEAPVEVEEALKIREVELEIPANGGDASILYRATSKVVAVSMTDWLDVTLQGDSLIVASAEANNDLMSRYARLLVKCGETSLTYTVQQAGQRTSGFVPDDLTFTAVAGSVSLEYDFDQTIVATTDVDWITLEATSSALVVSVSANTVQATKDNKERTGKISWNLGFDKGVINVSQRNLDFMQLDANWTVTYDGIVTVGTANKEAITNTVAATGSGKYVITYVEKSEVTSSGLGVADYLDITLVPKTALQLANGELSLYEETATANFDIFTAGNYYAFAIGFDEANEATGHYAFCEFVKAATGASYEAWLGKWTSKRGDATDTWEIVEKVKGTSYTITGIEAQANAPIEALYDSENAALVVKVQEGVGKYTSSNYGELDLGFYGAIPKDDGGSTFYKLGSTPYTIFTATLNDIDNASLTPGTVTSSGNQLTLQLAKYIGTSSEGKYISIHANTAVTPLPTTISRVGGSGSGGGGGGGNQGSDAYKKFLGSFSVTPGSGNTWTATIAANETDKTYSISGWEGWTYDWLSPMDANFNEDGSASFLGGTGKSVATNVTVDDSGEGFTLYYMGLANNFVITSDTEMYEACKATVGSDGNITLSPNNVTLNDGKSYPFSSLCIVAMNSAMTSIYTFKDRITTLPVTMTKASSSSIRTLSSLGLSLNDAERVEPSRIYVYDTCQPADAAQAD